MVEIFIDADACPVKDEVIKVAERHKLKVNVASNAWLRFAFTNVEIKQVVLPKTPDAADDWIAENINLGDIVVTSDIPLAYRCLQKKALAIRPNGTEFTEDNIGISLGMRELNSFLREIGEKGSSNFAFTAKNRSDFLSKLETMVQRSKLV